MGFAVRTASGPMPKPKDDPLEAARKRMGGWLFVVAFLMVLAATAAGAYIGTLVPISDLSFTPFACAACIILPILFSLLNLLLRKRYERSINKRNSSEMSAFFYSHRAAALTSAKKLKKTLGLLRLVSSAYALFFAAAGLILAFCSGLIDGAGWSFLAALLIACALSRIGFKPSYKLLKKQQNFLSQRDYPVFYGLAQKAAEKMGYSGKILLFALPDWNIGIKLAGDFCSVFLGVNALSVWNEEELYNVLLHEFSHAVQEGNFKKDRLYYDSICSPVPIIFPELWQAAFSFIDLCYSFNFQIYLYAVSVLTETEADRNMAERGDPAVAASALSKLKFHSLYEWEAGTEDFEPYNLLGETPPTDFLSREVSDFKAALEVRSEFWKGLVVAELPSRADTHPTLKMRLEAFGVTDAVLLPCPESGPFWEECKKALEETQRQISKSNAEAYEQNRKEAYLEPLAQIEKWEAAGRPLVAEEYADVSQALRLVGRISDCLDLFKRAIAELESPAAAFAHLMLGIYMLHGYDPAGIDHIYTAINQNQNFTEAGLSAIGKFCCLTGNQTQLDIYRQKADELIPQKEEVYDQIGILSKKDDLSAESLPEELLSSILSYIRSVDTGLITHIYLVRKNVSEDFYASAFVIRLKENAKPEETHELMNKIFHHLDTCSERVFSLFLYDPVTKEAVERVEGSLIYSADE